MIKFIQATKTRQKRYRDKMFLGSRFYFSGLKNPFLLSFMARKIAQEHKLRAIKVAHR